MRKLLLFILFNFFVGKISYAKDLDSLSVSHHSVLFMDWDNDMWLQKDYYYTQGANISFVHPVLRKNPLVHMLFQLNEADNYFGLGIKQEIYTPKAIKDNIIVSTDRPYAGALYLRSFSISNNPRLRLKLTNQLDIGVLGPMAGAELAQRVIHEWLNLEVPLGWEFQIDNRPYINYNIAFEKGLLEVPGKIEFIANSRLRVGNIHDDLSLGGLLRVGLLNNYFKGYRLSNIAYKENKSFQIYLYVGGDLRAVAYNAILMGGIVPPESSHQFSLKQIEPIVYSYYGGLHISYNSIGLNMQSTFISPEFRDGVSHGWGSVSLNYRF